ncbi:MAG: hypothetical protein KBT06_08615 [Prevotellaceae bacterium]|nr:hypothetical protein [Candidatus Colivivens equi]
MTRETWDRKDSVEKVYDELYSSPLYTSTQMFAESEQAFKDASHKITTAMRDRVGSKKQMNETKYYITVDNKTVAENVTIEYVRIFISAIFEVYFNEHDMVVAIAEMPRCKDGE